MCSDTRCGNNYTCWRHTLHRNHRNARRWTTNVHPRTAIHCTTDGTEQKPLCVIGRLFGMYPNTGILHTAVQAVSCHRRHHLPRDGVDVEREISNWMKLYAPAIWCAVHSPLVHAHTVGHTSHLHRRWVRISGMEPGASYPAVFPRFGSKTCIGVHQNMAATSSIPISPSCMPSIVACKRSNVGTSSHPDPILRSKPHRTATAGQNIPGDEHMRCTLHRSPHVSTLRIPRLRMPSDRCAHREQRSDHDGAGGGRDFANPVILRRKRHRAQSR